MSRRKLLVFIPARNEEESIGGVLDKLHTVFEHPYIKENFSTTEILVLNDVSLDKTVEVAKEKGATVYTHPGGHGGLGRNVRLGIDAVLSKRADIILSIDADGQFDPFDIPEMVRPIVEGRADVTIGSKFSGGRRPNGLKFTKYLGNHLVIKIVNYILGSKFTDVSCGFRAYSSEAFMQMQIWGDRTYVQESIMDLFYKGLTIVEVPINASYIKIRPSRVFLGGGVLGYGVRTLLILVRASRDYKALSIFGNPGIWFSTVGIVLCLLLLLHYLLSGMFSPYIFVGVIGASLFFLGAVLIVLAFVADMLSRMRIIQERQIFESRKLRYSVKNDE